VLVLAGRGEFARADSGCPAPVKPTTAAAAVVAPSPPSTRVDVTSAGIEAKTTDADTSLATLKGPVTIRQGNRTLSASTAIYDSANQSFDVAGNVVYRDPQLTVSGDTANWRPDLGGAFGNADFEIPARPARGHADTIAVDAKGRLELAHVDYTACPLTHRDWLLHAKHIDIDQEAQEGFGRSVRLDFMGVPILYLPIISFPVGDARKSGFLFPSFGQSGRNGFEVAAPYYWNLAPNYDATLTPGYLTKRGATFGTEFRFLTDNSRGDFHDDWVPYDSDARRDRDLLKFVERTDFTSRLRFDTNVNYASDSAYFEDFGQGPEGTSVTYLSRIARLTYLDSHWRAVGLIEQYQTIDQTVAQADRPYTRAPQITVNGRWNTGTGPGFEFRAEAVNFTRDVTESPGTAVQPGTVILPAVGLRGSSFFARNIDIQGGRYDVEPTASWTFQSPGAYLIPALAWRATRYALRDDPGADSAPAFSAPIATLDTGLTFERTSGSILQTLEPRALYTYIPYREQSQLPIFDTGLPDLNLIQLFRSERYVGGDRLGDANQVALGATTRYVDVGSGKQLLSATLGQIYYFTPPRVLLPTETASAASTSDLVSQVDISAYKHWNVLLGEQWDPHTQRSDLSEIRLQYKPTWDRVANFGYRYRRGLLDQLDGSFAWPIANSWNVYARHVYSLRDRAAIESLGGFEYQACCWRLRLVARRYVSSFTGTRDTGISLQLELNGLSSVGERADAFLGRSIRGYSATPSDSGPE
jgi:LPS-assembly protein